MFLAVEPNLSPTGVDRGSAPQMEQSPDYNAGAQE